MTEDLNDAVARLVLRHRFGEEECKDHFIETCACGAPDAEGLDDDAWSLVAHHFRWDEHIRAVIAVELPPLLANAGEIR